MNRKLHNIAKKRAHLLTEVVTQRDLLAQHIEVLRSPLELADRGLAALSYVKSHPILATSASIGLLSIARSNYFGKWLQRGWFIWQVMRKLSDKK